MTEVDVDVTTTAIRRAKLQSNRHHQKDQHPVFFTGRMPTTPLKLRPYGAIDYYYYYYLCHPTNTSQLWSLMTAATKWIKFIIGGLCSEPRWRSTRRSFSFEFRPPALWGGSVPGCATGKQRTQCADQQQTITLRVPRL